MPNTPSLSTRWISFVTSVIASLSLALQLSCSSQELLGQTQIASKSLPLICSPTSGEPIPAPVRPRWTSSIQKSGTILPQSSWPHRWTVVLADHCRTDNRLAKSFSREEVLGLSPHCVVSASPDYPMDHMGNDPLLADQTHLADAGITTAESILFEATTGITASTVLAIIDDGVDFTHPDLSPQTWINTKEIAANGIDDDNNGFIDDINGWNFGSNIASPAPQSGAEHGTHVAGLAAAKRNNTTGGQGIMGDNVKIMGLNVFGTSATTSTTFIINAIQYAVNNGAEVINLSLGGRGSSSVMESTLRWAADSGVVVIAAAGNAGEVVSASNFYIPMGYAASISGMIAVGSSNTGTGTLSSFSNRSTAFVEIAAPGSDPLSSGLLSTLPGNTYGRKQGTSMASPVVAGAAALIRAWAKTKSLTLTAGDIENILKSRSKLLPALSQYIQEGRKLDIQSVAEFLSHGCE